MKEIDKTIVRAGLDRAADEFTQRIKTFGFNRTKKWFWVRQKSNSADFVHLHVGGSSYGGPINYSVSFRVHCGNRLYNDSFEALALNGPNSDNPEFYAKRYHHRFNAKSGSTYERCIDDLVRFVAEEGLPWFKGLEATVQSGGTNAPELEKLSRKLLGIKQTRSAKKKGSGLIILQGEQGVTY